MALQLAKDVTAAETEYGTVLLDQRSGDYWELNPTGTIVIRTLLEGGEEADAVDAVVAEFDIGRSRAAQDVAALLDLLRTSGLTA
ncbi:hypothetical protein SSP35_10_02140 [Streptomyces sp. NBRC 110611]|uniref:lasso peptide biosynthesis PqqD family chaperone n=1 Tax=Streptomyces sp. NBRC 110611 TaxID=1621259 RepID=UPI0008325CE9|nr:lasso peptide biosynthesis PqqD family chaperone [Streptomyces sp. NBRC 110611]GAU69178.1 hypothetical protein SSP35_10_02140 [Streptomyces sp. NBRC 110611]